MTCKHESFTATVRVNREVKDNVLEKITGTAEVKCAQCGKPFVLRNLQQRDNSYGLFASFEGREYPSNIERVDFSNSPTTPNPLGDYYG